MQKKAAPVLRSSLPVRHSFSGGELRRMERPR